MASCPAARLQKCWTIGPIQGALAGTVDVDNPDLVVLRRRSPAIGQFLAVRGKNGKPRASPGPFVLGSSPRHLSFLAGGQIQHRYVGSAVSAIDEREILPIRRDSADCRQAIG